MLGDLYPRKRSSVETPLWPWDWNSQDLQHLALGCCVDLLKTILSGGRHLDAVALQTGPAFADVSHQDLHVDVGVLFTSGRLFQNSIFKSHH